MHIDAIDVFHVALPLCQPQETPFGRLEKIQTVLVRMESGGAAGWGEASPGNGPLAGAEWAAGVFGCIRDWLAPALVRDRIDSGARWAARTRRSALVQPSRERRRWSWGRGGA